MGETPRIGLLGCGGIGKVHADSLAALGQPLAAAADADPTRAGELAGKYGCRPLPDLAALLNETDAVIIATPPYLHAEQVIAAAHSGKHVFAEKPLCLTLADAARIGKALASSRGKFMIGYVLRFFPLFRTVREKLASGALGKLVACWDRRFSEWPFHENRWLRDPAKSGGMTVEFFTHDLDWLRWVGGFPVGVSGWTYKAYQGTESAIEDNVWATLKFARGLGTGAASWTSPLTSSALGILGEEGSISSVDGRPPVMRRRGGTEEILPLDGEEPYRAQMREFLACLAEGRDPSPGFSEARDALAIALAVQESARTGAPVVPARPA